MSLDDTATSPDEPTYDALTETLAAELRGPDPVPADYGGILDPNVRGDESGNVQQDLKDPFADDAPSLAAEDPYWKGYREAERDFNLRREALQAAVSIGGSSQIVKVNAKEFYEFLLGPATGV